LADSFNLCGITSNVSGDFHRQLRHFVEHHEFVEDLIDMAEDDDDINTFEEYESSDDGDEDDGDEDMDDNDDDDEEMISDEAD
jgi:hypothetical protein